MKKLSIFIFIFTAIIFTRCTDLTVAPEDGLSDVEAFKDPLAYRSYLAKIYGA